MKMSYLLRSNSRDGRKTLRSVSVVIALFIVILALQLIFPRFWGGVFSTLAYPFWKSENAVSRTLKGMTATFKSNRALEEENIRLKEELQLQKEGELLAPILQAENTELKEILERREHEVLILAPILRKPHFSPYDTLIIDGGKNQGISPGDSVVVSGSVLVGKVDEVYERSSKVKMFSSPGEKMEVLIGSSNIQAEAEGQGGGNFLVKLSREIDVKEGDAVVIPGITPKVFGVVEKIDTDATRAFQNILFKTPYNIFEIHFVQVVKKQ
jgi:rod shape-determining protein MreC